MTKIIDWTKPLRYVLKGYPQPAPVLLKELITDKPLRYVVLHTFPNGNETNETIRLHYADGSGPSIDQHIENIPEEAEPRWYERHQFIREAIGSMSCPPTPPGMQPLTAAQFENLHEFIILCIRTSRDQVTSHQRSIKVVMLCGNHGNNWATFGSNQYPIDGNPTHILKINPETGTMVGRRL